jgi:hypothetical protein
MWRTINVTLSFLLIILSQLVSCTPAPPNPFSNPSFPGGQGRNNEVPMSHLLTSNDWETLDSIWGANVNRHIFVNVTGFRVRVKKGPLGGEGFPSPGCVDYGGALAVFVDTVQVKGTAGETVNFVQGVGPCS